MLVKKSIASTAATTAGIALVLTGALAPAVAAESPGPQRGQERAAAAKTKKEQAAEKRRANARDGRAAEAREQRGTSTRGRSADAPYGKANGRSADRDDAPSERSEAGDNGLGDERGNGHTPVTVCHATGNGGFVEITFDENALENHLENHMKNMDDHQDFVVDEGAGCEELPAAADEVEGEETVVPGDTTSGTTTEAQILGAEAFAPRAADAPAVLGAEAVAAGSAAMPVAGPLTGILPQTGAAPLALAAAAGLGLVGAGATMVARRRREV